jgi:hypothetical protein
MLIRRCEKLGTTYTLQALEDEPSTYAVFDTTTICPGS